MKKLGGSYITMFVGYNVTIYTILGSGKGGDE